MELAEFVMSARMHWIRIVVLTLLGVAVGAGITLVSTPQWSVSSSVLLAVRQATSVSDLSQGASYLNANMASFAELVHSPTVQAEALSKAKSPLTPPQLDPLVSATVPADTFAIQITVTMSDRGKAVAVANALADAMPAGVAAYATEYSQDVSPVKVSTLTTATTPASPVSPRPTLNIIFGGIAGLAIAVLTILFGSSQLLRRAREASGVRASSSPLTEPR